MTSGFRPDGPTDRPDFGAFTPGPRVERRGAGSGPLSGLAFAAKDLFDVAGVPTGCGNPDWPLTHPAPTRNAAAIDLLLAAGADLVGKTVTDEISLGLLGRNRHCGAPVNPRAPDRYPGGSSSGSAALVAAGRVPIALGSDTGGSIRVPASFCGIHGLRPTHGAIPVDGLMTQAPSFDTAGFFAADAGTLARAGDVLLPPAPIGEIAEILIAGDAFACADPEVRAALSSSVARVVEAVGAGRTVDVAPEGLAVWNGHHVHLQHPEFAATFAPWVDAADPRLSYDVASAIARGRDMPQAARRRAQAFRDGVRWRIDTLLAGRRLLCLPTTPILAPRRDIGLAETAAVGGRLVDLTCIAGLTGLPQISLPFGRSEQGLPVGLSLIGWRGSDRTLIDLAQRLEAG